MTSTPLPEQGGFNERLTEILTQVAWYGSYKRSGEQPEGPTLSPDEAKAAIIKLFEQIIGEDWPKHCDEKDCRQCINRNQRNYQNYEIRQRLQALSNNGKE